MSSHTHTRARPLPQKTPHAQGLYDLALPFVKAMSAYGTGRRKSKAAAGKFGQDGMAVTKFFNRLLALKVDVQHDVFAFFEQVCFGWLVGWLVSYRRACVRALFPG